MSRELLIKKTVDNLTKLPNQKLKEVSDFTEFLLKKLNDDNLMLEAIQKIASESKTFEFLETEEELYTKTDLKEVYK